MTSVLARINRARPFLILAGVVVVALVVSLTWEGATSYDDRGIGGVAFLVIAAVSIPGSYIGLGLLGGACAFVALCLYLDISLARLTPIPRTSWWNFIRVMAQAAIIMAAVLVFKHGGDRDLGAAVAIFVLWLSMTAFFGFRWRALRQDLTTGLYSEADFLSDPRTKLIGPTRPALMWFVATLAAMFAVLIVDILHR